MERNFHFYAYFVCFDDKPVWLIILWLHLHSNSVKTVETPKREVQITKTNVYLFLALALHQQVWWCYKVANEANVLLHKLKLKAFAAYLANGSNFAVSAKSPFILSPITSDAQKAYHGLDFWIGRYRETVLLSAGKAASHVSAWEMPEVRYFCTQLHWIMLYLSRVNIWWNT